jgi:hypothetical protein
MNIRVILTLGIAGALILGGAGVGSAGLKKPSAPKAPGAGSSAASGETEGVDTSDDGKQIAISEDGKVVTHDCKGGQAAISSNKNKVTLKNCAQVSIGGNFNVVSAAGAETIAVAGNDNVVTWTKAAGGDAPDVADGGERNKVSGK